MGYTKKLQVFRTVHNITQQNMADKLGIGIVAYNLKENGKRAFTLKEAKEIADMFNTSVDDLFFKTK